MRKSIHITTPWPTEEEMKKKFPISEASEKAMLALVEEFKAQLSREEEARISSATPEKKRKRASAA